jgi:hypothetical protein
MHARQYISSILPAAAISLFFLVVNISLSKDYISYEHFFAIAQGSDWQELQQFASSNSIEYLYLLINKLWFANYTSFIAIVIFVSVYTKILFFSAMQRVYKTSKWYFVFTYIAVIGLLNDAAQLRIALATGLFMLGLTFALEGHTRWRNLFFLFSILFHTSTFLLVLGYIFYRHFNLLYKPLMFTVVFLVLKFLFHDFIIHGMTTFLEGSRYTSYLGLNADQQNTTGLYNYIFAALVLLVLAHDHAYNIYARTYNQTELMLANEKIVLFCRRSGYLAIYSMLAFSQSVSISMRFAELFIIFFSIFFVHSLRIYFKSTRLFNTFFILTIALVAAVRFYHTHVYLNPVFD